MNMVLIIPWVVVNILVWSIIGPRLNLGSDPSFILAFKSALSLVIIVTIVFGAAFIGILGVRKSR